MHINTKQKLIWFSDFWSFYILTSNNKLIEESKLELPEQLVIAEMDSILQNFMAELNQNNIKIEDYLWGDAPPGANQKILSNLNLEIVPFFWDTFVHLQWPKEDLKVS